MPIEAKCSTTVRWNKIFKKNGKSVNGQGPQMPHGQVSSTRVPVF